MTTYASVVFLLPLGVYPKENCFSKASRKDHQDFLSVTSVTEVAGLYSLHKISSNYDQAYIVMDGN